MSREKAMSAFLALSFLIFQAADVFAQDPGNSEKFWSGESSTCLLFSVQNLTATAYGGGIGLGFITSPTHMWRLSLNGYFEYDEKDASMYPGTSTNTRGLSLNVSPIWKMNSWDDLYMFMGPVISVGVFYERYNTKASSSYNATLGGNIGIGYVFHEQLSLTAEYGPYVTVLVSSDSKSFSARTGSGGMTLVVKL